MTPARKGSQPLTLGLDTSGTYCAVALVSGDTTLASQGVVMTRGQAENLMPMAEAVLAEAGCDWSQLDRIGVGTGPGNFTGIRIAVSAARGLALGLGVPSVGIDAFDVLTHLRPHIPALVPATRGRVYARAADGHMHMHDAPADLSLPDPADMARGVAMLAASRDPGTRPAPLYMRAADAAPSREQGPIMLDMPQP